MSVNEDAVRTYLRAREAGDTDLLRSVLTDDFAHEMNGRPQGGAELCDEAEAFATAVPDGHHEVLALVEEGDLVACHYRFSGTHTGPFSVGPGWVVPPTGGSVRFDGSFVARLRGGRLTSGWGTYDTAAIRDQLGF
jgi:predicted ester cyclase